MADLMVPEHGSPGAVQGRSSAEYAKRGEEWYQTLAIWCNPSLITPQRPPSSPSAQYFRVCFPIWFLPPLTPFAFFVTEKIELPNSTSTEVEMTPSSEASEPVQNGNLSHSIEAAEAQVGLLFIASLGRCFLISSIAAQRLHSPWKLQLPVGRTQAEFCLSLCVFPSTSPGPTYVTLSNH